MIVSDLDADGLAEFVHQLVELIDRRKHHVELFAELAVLDVEGCLGVVAHGEGEGDAILLLAHLIADARALELCLEDCLDANLVERSLLGTFLACMHQFLPFLVPLLELVGRHPKAIEALHEFVVGCIVARYTAQVEGLVDFDELVQQKFAFDAHHVDLADEGIYNEGFNAWCCHDCRDRRRRW